MDAAKFQSAVIEMLKKLAKVDTYTITEHKSDSIYMHGKDITGKGVEYSVKNGSEVIFSIAFAKMPGLGDEYILKIDGEAQPPKKFDYIALEGLFEYVQQEYADRNSSRVDSRDDEKILDFLRRYLPKTK